MQQCYSKQQRFEMSDEQHLQQMSELSQVDRRKLIQIIQMDDSLSENDD
jgi:predicted transcriptional regulator